MDEEGECGGDDTLVGFVLTWGSGVCGACAGRSGCFSLHGVTGIGFFVIEIGRFFTSFNGGSGVAAVACCNIVKRRKGKEGGGKVKEKRKEKENRWFRSL
jgi:hypothetical protein